MEGKIKIGPAGKKDVRSSTVNWDEGSHNGIISQIFISHGSDGILSIQFQFVLDDKFVLSDHHGQNTGSKFDVIALNSPHEYITGISGTYSKHHTSPTVKSLKVTTNANEYGPFGSWKPDYDAEFGFKLRKFRQFGGFYGTYDALGLENIGVYLQPTLTVKPKSKPKTGTSNAEEIESTIVLG